MKITFDLEKDVFKEVIKLGERGCLDKEDIINNKRTGIRELEKTEQETLMIVGFYYALAIWDFYREFMEKTK